MSESKSKEVVLTGIPGSPGICIGKAYVVDQEGVELVERYSLAPGDLAAEKKRFKAAVKKAKNELHAIIENTPEEFRQHADILETHVVLLKDKMLYTKTIETIEKERVNAEWALKQVVSRLKPMFQEMTDPYLRERASDIVHVSERIMRNLTGSPAVDIRTIDKRVILVARDLSPAETSQIQLEKIKGFLTDLGGRVSHTSIIARTLGIPAVLGLEDASLRIQTDEIIIVDGGAGKVVLHPSEQTLLDYEERQERYEHYVAMATRESHKPARTRDGLDLKVMGNIELPEEVVTVLDHGGEGIGLWRTEFQYLGRRSFPGEDELYEKYLDVAGVMGERPLTIRTLDINGDKALAYDSGTGETNPALGLRAIRYCLKKPEVFLTQLRAILRAAASGNIRILLPMISSVDEIRAARKYIHRAAMSLKSEGKPFGEEVQLGIMIEVPSAAVIADHLAEEADFFSLGTNDLIQYTLAIDRANPEVAELYKPLHPAVIRLVNFVSEVARDKGIPLYMCGEMACDPAHVPILLGLDLDELSMNPLAIPAVKRMIRAIRASEAREFVKEILRETTCTGVMDRIREAYGGVISEQIYNGGAYTFVNSCLLPTTADIAGFPEPAAPAPDAEEDRGGR